MNLKDVLEKIKDALRRVAPSEWVLPVPVPVPAKSGQSSGK